eukprot:scaffold212540_cov26-Prasinocladus_malaysianus.AAC.1
MSSSAGRARRAMMSHHNESRSVLELVPRGSSYSYSTKAKCRTCWFRGKTRVYKSNVMSNFVHGAAGSVPDKDTNSAHRGKASKGIVATERSTAVQQHLCCSSGPACAFLHHRSTNCHLL